MKPVPEFRNRLFPTIERMKRLFVFAAALVFAVSACDNTTTQEKMDAYDDALDVIMSEYRDRVSAIDLDETLLMEGRAEEEYDKAVKTAEDKIVDLTVRTVRKNPKDTIALFALQRACGYISDYERFAPAVDALSGDIAGDEFVQDLKEVIDVRLKTAEGKMFTDFTVDTFIGDDENGEPIFQKVSLSDFVGKGKYFLVDFWSPWCGPCKREIPNIKAVYDKYHGDDFDVLSIAVWEDSRHMNYRNTVDTAAVYGMNWNLLNNGKEEPAALYGIEGIPHIILFGPDGTILKRNLYDGGIDKAVSEALGR